MVKTEIGYTTTDTIMVRGLNLATEIIGKFRLCRHDLLQPGVCRAEAAARHGMTSADVGLWELNEAFASQVLYCQQKLGISDTRLNVSGGAISVGHPFGMSGAA
ncbi:hypothetical protein AWV80_41205 [Cupriavidus sp. UYMU48A]|nr:hypothetical protein AWV80_41205 [Cupriavidus sp. UYMU48A]